MLKNDLMSRRSFIAAAGSVAAAHSLGGRAIANRADDLLLYVGTYTSGPTKSEGIYIYRFDVKTGGLALHKVVSSVVEPSFLAISKNRRYLYAVNETLEYEGKKSGAVSAFAIDGKTGDLRFINKQASLGAAPCHLSVSSNGNFVLVANYLGGNVSVYPVSKDGSLGASVDLEQHAGKGPKDQQEAPHAHSVILDAANKFVFVNDLGIDQIVIYGFDKKTGKLTPNAAQRSYATRPGAGPRHFKIHPDGRFAFAVNELDMTVTSLAFDVDAGTLKEVQTISTLPADFKGENSCADIHVSPNGDFLYASNRGHDSIVSYKIDKPTGRIALMEHTSTGGKAPRNFAIDPTGSYLLAANQRSDSIVVFSIDSRTGKLRPTGNTLVTPSPVCLIFG